MKISDARKAYSAQMDSLRSKRQELTKLLENGEKAGTDFQDFDRVEISKKLAIVEAQYTETQKVMEQISTTEGIIRSAESAKQQGESMKKATDDLIKIMIIMRRIMAGDKVPPQDEKRLMEYDAKLYMMAKNIAITAKNKDGKEHDSLWEEEEDASKEKKTATEIAADSEISVPLPDAIANDANWEQF